MEKRCMPIKSLPACKKQLTKPITEEQRINFNTANNQVPQALKKK
jgi:hypothetical protein